jgi:hypothetical protein
MMRIRTLAILSGVILYAAGATQAFAAECSGKSGDLVLNARTPEVDLYASATGSRVMTLDESKFPECVPITGRAPNMMIQILWSGKNYWVPPHMVKYRFAGKLPAVCRNLAMGSNEQKVGATRGLGEGCPSAKGTNP